MGWLNQSLQDFVFLCAETKVEEELVSEVNWRGAFMVISLLVVHEGVLVHCLCLGVDQSQELLLIVLILDVFLLLPRGYCHSLDLFLLHLLVRNYSLSGPQHFHPLKPTAPENSGY